TGSAASSGATLVEYSRTSDINSARIPTGLRRAGDATTDTTPPEIQSRPVRAREYDSDYERATSQPPREAEPGRARSQVDPCVGGRRRIPLRPDQDAGRDLRDRHPAAHGVRFAAHR